MTWARLAVFFVIDLWRHRSLSSALWLREYRRHEEA